MQAGKIIPRREAVREWAFAAVCLAAVLGVPALMSLAHLNGWW